MSFNKSDYVALLLCVCYFSEHAGRGPSCGRRQSVHRYSGLPSEHSAGLLENGLSGKHSCYCHDNQGNGARQGEARPLRLLHFISSCCKRILPISFDNGSSKNVTHYNTFCCVVLISAVDSEQVRRLSFENDGERINRYFCIYLSSYIVFIVVVFFFF